MVSVLGRKSLENFANACRLIALVLFNLEVMETLKVEL